MSLQWDKSSDIIGKRFLKIHVHTPYKNSDTEVVTMIKTAVYKQRMQHTFYFYFGFQSWALYTDDIAFLMYDNCLATIWPLERSSRKSRSDILTVTQGIDHNPDMLPQISSWRKMMQYITVLNITHWVSSGPINNFKL